MKGLTPKYWKQILLLLIITPILTELLTNNIPVPEFFKLKTFLILSTLGYAPVLLLRELAVRWKLGFTGYILLGLVYGLYNEGLLAQTIFHAQLPNPTFNNYGVTFGINFSWTTIILIFHAFYAFLFPSFIMYYVFPASAQKPWINKRLWLIISAGFFIYISLKFLEKMPPHITLWHYIFLVLTMSMLIVLSKFFKNEKMFELKRMKALPLCLYGFVFVVSTFILSDVIIKSGTKPLIFILYLLVILFGTILLLRKKSIQALMVFCLTAEISFALGALLVAKTNNSIIGVITEVIFILIFSIVLGIVIKKKKYHLQMILQ